MGNTPNHDIYYLSSGDPQSQITESATQAGTIEAALDGISGNIDSVNNFGVRHFANASARDLALTNPEVGWLTQLDSELFMRRWDGTAWRPYGSGMFPIAIGSVSGTGVTATPRGVVEFSAASSVSVNGVFSTEFKDYLIELEITAASTDLNPGIQLRSSGTDATTNYNNHYSAGTGTSMVVAAGSTDRFNVSLTAGRQASVSFMLHGPSMARATLGRVTYSGFNNSGSGFEGLISNRHTTTSAYDGFTVIASAAGNFTGSLRVFGVA